MREEAKVLRFGSIIPISGSDFVREVSQAPPDVWVVVHLYKEGYTLRHLKLFISLQMYNLVTFLRQLLPFSPIKYNVKKLFGRTNHAVWRCKISLLIMHYWKIR